MLTLGCLCNTGKRGFACFYGALSDALCDALNDALCGCCIFASTLNASDAVLAFAFKQVYALRLFH